MYRQDEEVREYPWGDTLAVETVAEGKTRYYYPLPRRVVVPAQSRYYRDIVSRYNKRDEQGFCWYDKFPSLFVEAVQELQAGAGELSEKEQAILSDMYESVHIGNICYQAISAQEWLDQYPDEAAWEQEQDVDRWWKRHGRPGGCLSDQGKYEAKRAKAHAQIEAWEAIKEGRIREVS